MLHQLVGIHAVCPCNKAVCDHHNFAPCTGFLAVHLVLVVSLATRTKPSSAGLLCCTPWHSTSIVSLHQQQAGRYACMAGTQICMHAEAHTPSFTSLHLSSPHLTSPCLYFASTHFTSPYLILPHFTSPNLASHHLTLPHLTSHRLTFASPLLNSIMSFWCSNPGEPWARASQMSSRGCY